MHTIFDTLDSFKDLQENWDSYGALPIKGSAIAEAKVFIDKISNFVNKNSIFCTPLPDGCVQVEFVLGSSEFEVEILNSNEASMLIQKGRVFFDVGDYTTDSIIALVKETHRIIHQTFEDGEGI